MTNTEKFEEVFGFPPHHNAKCVVPTEICNDFESCSKCPFRHWWSNEYKPCFTWKGANNETN